MRSIVSYLKSTAYSDIMIASVRKSQLLSYIKHPEIMSEIADQLGEAEIIGDWKLAENLGSRMGMVTAAEMKAVLNRYAQNITWVYIGEPNVGKQSFDK